MVVRFTDALRICSSAGARAFIRASAGRAMFGPAADLRWPPPTPRSCSNVRLPSAAIHRIRLNQPVWHGTTILTVRKGGLVAVGGDGQVSIGQTIVKANAKRSAGWARAT